MIQSNHMALAAFAPPSVRSASSDLISLIGNTPLIRLERMAADLPGVEIYGKAEFANPGGSVKDRAALNMILDGERTGRLTPERTLLDATSGNTGIAYAMLGAYKGYKVKLCLPRNASKERKHILHAYGAEDGVLRSRRRLGWRDSPVPEDLRSRSGPLLLSRSVQQPCQLAGPLRRNGSRNHRPDTGPHHSLRSAMGTSGTFMGTSRRLHRELPHVKCISAQPSSGFHGLEGLKHMPTAIVPGIYDRTSGRR